MNSFGYKDDSVSLLGMCRAGFFSSRAELEFSIFELELAKSGSRAHRKSHSSLGFELKFNNLDIEKNILANTPPYSKELMYL